MSAPCVRHRLYQGAAHASLFAILLLATGCGSTPPQNTDSKLHEPPRAEQAAAVVPTSDAEPKTDAEPPEEIVSASGNVGVAEIPDVSAFRQVVALSDVHGMFANLARLLSACRIITPEGHWLADRTLLIVTGDSIDKGPQSLEVIDLWRTLCVEAPRRRSRVVVLLGNHEAEFLANPHKKKSAALRDELKTQGLDVEEVTDSTHPRARFLRSLPLAARVGKRWLFCHAGWIPKMDYADFVAQAQSVLQSGDYESDLLLDESSILEKSVDSEGEKWWKSAAEVKDLEDRLTQDGLYGVVFGHQPAAFGLAAAVGAYDAKDARLIKIDSGMAPDAGSHPGHLLLFTTPEELMRNQRPAHIFSSGFDDGHPELRTRPL